MNELRFSYTPTIRDRYIGSLVLLAHSPVRLAISSLFPIAGFAIIVLSFRRDVMTVSDLVCALLAIFFTPILLTIGIATQRFRLRGMSRSQHFQVSEGGISVSWASSKMEFKWDAFESASETGRNLVLKIKAGTGIVLPTYVLNAQQLQTLRALVGKGLDGRARLRTT